MGTKRPHGHRTPRVEPLEARALLSTFVFEAEPNTSAATATPVVLDPATGPTVVVGSIGSRGDQDFYRVRSSVPGTVGLQLLSPSRSLTVSVQDTFGMRSPQTRRSGPQPFVIVPGLDVILSVRALGRGSTGMYAITLTETPLPVPPPPARTGPLGPVPIPSGMPSFTPPGFAPPTFTKPAATGSPMMVVLTPLTRPPATSRLR